MPTFLKRAAIGLLVLIAVLAGVFALLDSPPKPITADLTTVLAEARQGLVAQLTCDAQGTAVLVTYRDAARPAVRAPLPPSTTLNDLLDAAGVDRSELLVCERRVPWDAWQRVVRVLLPTVVVIGGLLLVLRRGVVSTRS